MRGASRSRGEGGVESGGDKGDMGAGAGVAFGVGFSSDWQVEGAGGACTWETGTRGAVAREGGGGQV